MGSCVCQSARVSNEKQPQKTKQGSYNSETQLRNCKPEYLDFLQNKYHKNLDKKMQTHIVKKFTTHFKRDSQEESYQNAKMNEKSLNAHRFSQKLNSDLKNKEIYEKKLHNHSYNSDILHKSLNKQSQKHKFS